MELMGDPAQTESLDLIEQALVCKICFGLEKGVARKH